MIERVKQEGRKVGALAGAAQHAERHVNAGVDVIIAQGSEAGGHTGEIGTMVLIPEIVDAVGEHPGARRRRASAAAGRWRQRWRSVRKACGAGRCGSRPTRPRHIRSSRRSSSHARSSDTVRSRVAHRQAGAAAASRRGPRSGSAPDTPDPLGMPLQPILVDEGDPAHRPRRPPPRLGRRADSPTTSSARSSAAMNESEAGGSGRLRDDRGVHRTGRATRPHHQRLSSRCARSIRQPSYQRSVDVRPASRPLRS